MSPDRKHSKLTDRRAELQRLREVAWPSAGRQERIARAQAAWALGPPQWELDAKMLRVIAEDPDLEYDD